MTDKKEMNSRILDDKVMSDEQFIRLLNLKLGPAGVERARAIFSELSQVSDEQIIPPLPLEDPQEFHGLGEPIPEDSEVIVDAAKNYPQTIVAIDDHVVQDIFDNSSFIPHKGQVKVTRLTDLSPEHPFNKDRKKVEIYKRKPEDFSTSYRILQAHDLAQHEPMYQTYANSNAVQVTKNWYCGQEQTAPSLLARLKVRLFGTRTWQTAKVDALIRKLDLGALSLDKQDSNLIIYNVMKGKPSRVQLCPRPQGFIMHHEQIDEKNYEELARFSRFASKHLEAK